MYADDSIMCCLFPSRCNSFPQTPVVIFSSLLEYINMIIVFSSPFFIAWSVLRIMLQFVEVKLKLILFHKSTSDSSVCWTTNLKWCNNSVIFSTFLFNEYSWYLDCIVYLYFCSIRITIQLIIYLCPCVDIENPKVT